MADTLDLGSSAARCAGSTPAPSTSCFLRVEREVGQGHGQGEALLLRRLLGRSDFLHDSPG